MNENRKRITTYWMDKTIKLVESTSLKDDKVLVIYLPECNESIAGIVAGRLKEHYNKPVFVLTNSTYGLKGSGRSIESYKMYDEICKCKEY